MQNSDSMGRQIARELRAGNRLHPCDGCGAEVVTLRTEHGCLCEDCRAALKSETPSDV